MGSGKMAAYTITTRYAGGKQQSNRRAHHLKICAPAAVHQIFNKRIAGRITILIIGGIGLVVEHARDGEQAIRALSIRGREKIKRCTAKLPAIVGFELRASAAFAVGSLVITVTTVPSAPANMQSRASVEDVALQPRADKH